MAENSSPVKIARYPSLNGLRAISIIIVMLHHLNLQYKIVPSVLVNYFPLLIDGQFGVNVFFVISGFLITSLLLSEEFSNRSISLKNFYIRRTLRIFPAYYFLLLVYFVITRLGYISISGQSWLTALTYTKYFNWQLDWYTSHAWSLSVEEHFYLFWPLIFITGNKTRKYFIFFILLLIPSFRIIFWVHKVSWINDLTIFYRLDAIATGCLFALYQDKIIKLLSAHWKKIFYTSISIIFLLPFLIPFNVKHNLHLGFIILLFGQTYGTLANVCIALVMMASIFGLKGTWFKFLNSAIMNQIGILSYSIYLWQQMFLIKTGFFINKFPLNLLFIAIAALASYYLIEKPFLRLKSKFSFQKEYT
jgi:peptidoglycan/LPS O-acetylase OafA/YrhL